METINEPQTQGLQFRFSYFPTLWKRESTVITLQQLFEQTTSPLWKPKTESYRKLKSCPTRENEAKMTKDSMPVVIIEGVIRPHCSHASSNLDSMNGLGMYDFDHTNQRTAAIKDLFRQLPYVAYTHTSISGEGLKVVVYLDAHTPEEYPLAYAICQQTLERIANHPSDPQCARLTQPCSCVWDADAYYNPSPQPYPWREELAVDPSLTQLLPSSNPSISAPQGSGSYTYAATSNNANTTGKTSSPLPPATEACGYIEAFALTFAQYQPWHKGNRHASMLTMGRSARRKGFSKEELEKLTNIMAVKIVDGSYTLRELRKDLLTGYQYVDLSYNPHNNLDSLPQLPTATFAPISGKNTMNREDDLSANNEEIRTSTPLIPDEVYTRLPDFFKEALKAARNKRERDILLLGIIINLSGCMLNVRVTYDQRPLSTHLYLLVIAPPASGKGVLSLANMLPEGINNYLKEENKRKKETYERELKAYEESQHHHARKGQQPADQTAPSAMPEEPVYHYLCGAPNTSKNQIINRLRINEDLGLIISATELDMISGALKQDYGKHDDVFRAAFHHESVATDYKIDRQLVSAETPRLALCLSGTPNQLPSFIRSLDNGLYDRFIIYTCGARWKYRSAAPIKGQEDYITLYRRLSQQVLHMFYLFQQSPTEITLTDQQWEEHTAYFECLLNEVASEQTDAPGSIVLRAALITVRIAAIFTAIRKYEGGMHMKECICTDEDFRSALQIVQTTTNHSLLVSSSLPGDDVKSKPLQSYFRIRPIINSLPEIFTYKEVKEKALPSGISERSTFRYLKNLTEAGYIEKQGDSYKKIKKITAK